jgi:general secretion pathway protein D
VFLWRIYFPEAIVKKTAALLILGLVIANVLYAEDIHLLSAPTGTSSGQADLQRIKAGDNYVTLNFTNIDIAALVKVMSALTRRNFVLDERVAGKVTLMTPTKITPDEAYQVFLSALEIKGFTAVEDGMVTRIIPAATARQSGLKVYKDDDFSGQGFVTKLFRLTYVNPNEIARTLTQLVSRDGSLIPYPATNSLIITDAIYNVKKMESLIHALDVPALEGKGKINVYYLKNANAEDFAKVMSALVSHLPVPPAGGAAARQVAGPSTILEGQVTITADKATNSLIIVASPGDYETIKDVIQKLDIRRRQVYVEAEIIEMSLAKQRELGIEFQATNLNNLETSNKTSVIGGTNFGNIAAAASGPAGLATLTGLNVGAVKGTFKFNGQEFLNIGALLHALETNGDVNVLSTPNLLTLDNQKAEIMVGENVPFVTGQTQNAATGGSSILTSIDRKDIGIKLQITPQISSDDNVRLEIKQEISDITVTPGLNPNIVGPSTSKRSADTTVVIKDRQTMVIGGLIRDNLTTSTSKVPLLGDIPILGWLFKFKTTKIEKTNLMIFITPYIIKDETGAAEITKKKNDTLDEFRKEYHIEKKGSEPVIPAPSQPKPDQRTGSSETQGAAAPALQTAPTGSAAVEQPAPAGTMQSAPPLETAPTGSAAVEQPAPAGTTQAVPALETAPTGSATVEQSAPTGTTQPAPEVVR